MGDDEIELSDLHDAEGVTERLNEVHGGVRRVRRFRLVVVDGPLAGRTYESTGQSCAVGSHPSNDLVIDDPSVSRFHCELAVEAAGMRLKDAGSTNGTQVDGM